MKKVILSLVMVLAFSLQVNAQENYTTYTSNGEDIKVSIVVKEGKSQGHVYLDILKTGDLGLMLDNASDINRLKTLAVESYVKYKEWVKLAKESNVTDVIKEINSSKFDVYFKYGSWKFSYNKPVKFGMQISKTGVETFYCVVPKVTASDNKYIKSKTGVVLFSDEEELNSFINCLDITKMNEFILSENKKADMFN